jgi:hypothetical protein
MADVTLACAARSIVLSEDPPYVARCDTQAWVSHRDTPISISAASDDDLGQSTSTLGKVGQTNRANLRERRRRLAKARGQQANTKPVL